MKDQINIIFTILLLLFCTLNLSAQFLTTEVKSLEIKLSSSKDSISISAGDDFIKGYGKLENPTIVGLKQDSLHFCFVIKTERQINSYVYTKHYLFAGIKKTSPKQIILDYELFGLNIETGIKSHFIIDPVIIIDPKTILIKYFLSNQTPSDQEKTNPTSKENFTILRLTANGIDRYKLYSSGGIFFHNDAKKIRTNEN